MSDYVESTSPVSVEIDPEGNDMAPRRAAVEQAQRFNGRIGADRVYKDGAPLRLVVRQADAMVRWAAEMLDPVRSELAHWPEGGLTLDPNAERFTLGVDGHGVGRVTYRVVGHLAGWVLTERVSSSPDETGLTAPCDGQCGDITPHDAHLAPDALDRLDGVGRPVVEQWTVVGPRPDRVRTFESAGYAMQHAAEVSASDRATVVTDPAGMQFLVVRVRPGVKIQAVRDLT